MSYTHEPADRLTPTDGSLRGEIRILFPSQSLSDRFKLYSHYIQSFSPCQCFCLNLNIGSCWKRELVLILRGWEAVEAVARPRAGNPSQAGQRFWREEEMRPACEGAVPRHSCFPCPFSLPSLSVRAIQGKTLLCTGENVKMNLNHI